MPSQSYPFIQVLSLLVPIGSFLYMAVVQSALFLSSNIGD